MYCKNLLEQLLERRRQRIHQQSTPNATGLSTEEVKDVGEKTQQAYHIMKKEGLTPRDDKVAFYDRGPASLMRAVLRNEYGSRPIGIAYGDPTRRSVFNVRRASFNCHSAYATACTRGIGYEEPVLQEVLSWSATDQQPDNYFTVRDRRRAEDNLLIEIDNTIGSDLYRDIRWAAQIF